jgi:hypothetical protein
MDKHGQVTTGIVVGVIATVMLVILGVLVVSNFIQATDNTSINDTANPGKDAYTQIKTNTWTAFTLLAILVLLVVAVGMIGIIKMVG